MKCVFLFLILSVTVNAAEPLRVAAVQGPPHVTSSEANPPTGVAPDFLTKYVFPEIKKKFKIETVWRSSPFKRELRDLENSNIDMLFFVLKTPEREKIFNYSSEPFLSEYPGMIVHKDFQKGKTTASIHDFAGKTVGVMAGAVLPEEFIKLKINTVSLSGDDIGERLSNLVETHRIDGVFVHLASITQDIVERNKFDNLKSVEVTDTPQNKVYVAFSKKLSPAVTNEIDRLMRVNRKFYHSKN
jgi:polar amino acid transport system substrate-binding protein